MGKPNLVNSYKSNEMHFWVGTKDMLFMEMVNLAGHSKISYVNPHQTTFHFKGLWKIWRMVKTRNCSSMLQWRIYLFYHCSYFTRSFVNLICCFHEVDKFHRKYKGVQPDSLTQSYTTQSIQFYSCTDVN